MSPSLRRRPGDRGRRLAEQLRSPLFRGRVLLAGWMLALGGLLYRAGEIQLREGGSWRAEAERQHQAQALLPAPRGGILDREGAPLAQSRETFRVAVAPHELADRDRAAELLADVLGLSPAEVRRATHGDRRWVTLPGLHPPRVREALHRTRGIHVERVLSRFHPHGELARGILGVVIDEIGAGGIEQAFEPHLSGVPGSQIVARDSEGRPIPGESWVVQPPRAGGDVVLTLDRDLQEIAQAALTEAVSETGARGGDLVVADPRTGEILAMVALRDGSTNALSGINAPFEPGSTLKPFVVAGLLELGRVSMADSVDTGDGRLRVAGRTISDVSRVGNVTLAHALRVSSNVAMARIIESHTPLEQYEVLRDFGFGLPTGIPIPGEAGGTLRHPRHWSGQSAVSLAIGYEMAATPLQVTMAYAALANGGILMEPRLVREIRSPDGRVLERFEPRPVRRVVSERVAAEVSRTLVEAVEEGTGTRANLGAFRVAGKTGTSRATGPDGRYEAGAFFSSFVGFFPAERPQLVVFVKLDRPQGAFFGGVTAAPVTRATMEAVLAARHPPLDREALASLARAQEEARRQALEAGRLAALVPEPDPRTPAPGGPGVPVPATGEGRVAAFSPGGPGVLRQVAGPPARGVDLLLHGWREADADLQDLQHRSEAIPGVEVLVPDLRGMTPRSAVRRLHALGLQVRWEGEGVVRSTRPAAGARLLGGDTLVVVAQP